MKKIVALIATAFAVSAFAQTASAPVASAPSKVVTADCGKNNEKCLKVKPMPGAGGAGINPSTKSEPPKDQKAEAPKK